MPRVLVTYYTRSGHTEAMAKAVAEGVKSVAEMEVQVRPVGEVSPDDLLQYDGIIFGSPVYYGSMAAEVKKLIDESVKHHGKLTGKVGGAFATSGVAGGGCETTILDLLNALLIHGMIVQGTAGGPHYGPISVGAPDEKACTECQKLGARVAELVRRLSE
jgi:NAD(P)H dehydrogenase (quinone)